MSLISASAPASARAGVVGFTPDPPPTPRSGPVGVVGFTPDPDVVPQTVDVPATVATPTLDRLGLSGADIKAGHGPQPAHVGAKSLSLGIDALTGVADALGGTVGLVTDIGTLPWRKMHAGGRELLRTGSPSKAYAASSAVPALPVTHLAGEASEDLRRTLRSGAGLDDSSETGIGPAVRLATSLLTPIPAVGSAGRAAREAAAVEELARVPLFKSPAARARQMEALAAKFPNATIARRGSEYVVRGVRPPPMVPPTVIADAAKSAENAVPEVISTGKLFTNPEARLRQLDALEAKYPDATITSHDGATFTVTKSAPKSAPKPAIPASPSTPAGATPTLLNEASSSSFQHADLGGLPFSTDAAKRVLLEVPGSMRSLSTSYDVSAPFRQGVFFVGSKEFWKSLPAQFTGMAERNYNTIQVGIAVRPTFGTWKKAGLALTNIGKNVLEREEAYPSTWAEKVPGVVQSERGYTAFLNKLRMDKADDLGRKSEAIGLKLLDVEGNVTDQARAIARYVNAGTGRGHLSGRIGDAQGLLNAAFFSPRLISSRLTLMNPMYYAKLPPVVRQDAIKSLVSFVGFVAGLGGVARMGGAHVNYDPRSSDFLKIRIGDTRIDAAGGFQQFAVLATRIGMYAANELTGGTTPEVVTTGGTSRKIGGSDRFDPALAKIVWDFLKNKAAPLASFGITAATSHKDKNGNRVDDYGQPLDLVNNFGMRWVPMVAQDIYEVYKSDPRLIPLTAPASALGMGVQTFSSTPRKDKRHGITPKGIAPKGVVPGGIAPATGVGMGMGTSARK